MLHLLERKAFGQADPARGRFRSFLLSSLQNFLADQRDRQQALKRGGGRPIISFDAQDAEQRYCLEPVDPATPESLFERRWALTLLHSALRRLEQEFVGSGRATLFDELRGCIVEGAENRTYAEIGRQLGMSEEAVKKAAQRLRRRYQEVIREEIAHTVATPGEIEEELRHLWSVLGG